MWRTTKIFNIDTFAKRPEPEDPALDRANPLTVIKCVDLIKFAECPARWVRSQEELPAKGYDLSGLIHELILTAGTDSTRVIREPDVYQAKVMVCPGCDSESQSKHCTACDMDRKPKLVEKPWSPKAKPCLAWACNAVTQGRYPVRSYDYDKALEAAQAVNQDPDVAAFMQDSWLNATIMSEWVPRKDADPIIVSQRLDILPSEGHPLDCALGLVYVCSDSAHGKHSSIAHYRYYHMHAALALDMANAAGRQEFREVLQVLVEPNPPYMVSRRRLSPQFIQEGRRLVEETLLALSVCRESGMYPTFDPSAPKTLHGWSRLDHDPAQHEGAEKSDARFGPASVALLAAAKN